MTPNETITPGWQHALGAFGLQLLFVAVAALAFCTHALHPMLWAGGAYGGWMLLAGRELHTCQALFGVRWGFIPRGVQARTWRDIGWPALGVALPFILVLIVERT